MALRRKPPATRALCCLRIRQNSSVRSAAPKKRAVRFALRCSVQSGRGMPSVGWLFSSIRCYDATMRFAYLFYRVELTSSVVASSDADVSDVSLSYVFGLLPCGGFGRSYEGVKGSFPADGIHASAKRLGQERRKRRKRRQTEPHRADGASIVSPKGYESLFPQ